MLTDEELAIYELAFHLKCSASYIKYEMPYEEFIKWHLYFDLRPVDWRDDSRFMKILQSLGVKESGDKIFESLAKIKQSAIERNEMIKSLKASVMYKHLLGAVGGTKLKLLEEL